MILRPSCCPQGRGPFRAKEAKKGQGRPQAGLKPVILSFHPRPPSPASRPGQLASHGPASGATTGPSTPPPTTRRAATTAVPDEPPAGSPSSRSSHPVVANDARRDVQKPVF